MGNHELRSQAKKRRMIMISQVIQCIALSTIVIAVYLYINYKIDIKLSRNYTQTEDITLMNEIENFSVLDGNFVFDGYAFKLAIDSSKSNISLFLHNHDTKKDVWADMLQSERPDISSYYGSDYNYMNTGFRAVVSQKSLNLDNLYEIFIKLDYEDIRTDDKKKTTTHKIKRAVSTNRYLLNGKIYDYNPYEFDEPDMNVKSVLLREVFSNGRLCFYQKEAGMYVYQYAGKLFWVATPDFEFNINGDEFTIVPYHLSTSQVDKLPEHRIQHAFDNLGLRFEEVEYHEEDTSPYRIVVFDIPKEYPITYVTTGQYSTSTNEWIWIKSFHLSDME